MIAQLNLFNYKKYAAKIFVLSALLIMISDVIYKTVFNISPYTKDKCLVYKGLPKWLFLFYENIIELMLIVIAGIFAGVLIEKYFSRLKRFVPSNIFTAFIYAAVIPVCSCSVIPLIKTMADKMKPRVLITFIMAAPLLNPYIIMVSFSLLGLKYAVLRIIFSFFLAASTGYILELFLKGPGTNDFMRANGNCQKSSCHIFFGDLFELTMHNFKKIFPYVLFAGIISLIFSLSFDKNFINSFNFQNQPVANVLIILLGIPAYFCNGSDVVFLNPFVKFAHLPLGTALAFSLTSTAVCISSAVLLFKYIGKKFTILLLSVVLIVSIFLGLITNIFNL